MDKHARILVVYDKSIIKNHSSYLERNAISNMFGNKRLINAFCNSYFPTLT